VTAKPSMPSMPSMPVQAPAVIPPKAESVAKVKAAVPVPTQPPLVLIREGVAKQDRGSVRAALRMAVEQGTQIDAPVLDMLRKWLSEEDESLNILSARAGLPAPEPKASQAALAVSTAKAAAPGQVPPTPVVVAPKVHSAAGRAPVLPGPVVPGPVAASEKAPAPASEPEAPAIKELTAKAAPEKRPPPQPVIQRGPMLKNATSAPPKPDLDASFDAFLQELTVEEAVAPAEEPAPPEPQQPATKKRKTDEAESGSPPLPPEEEQPPPPPEPISKPPMRKPPEKPKKPAGPTKDEWGRDVTEEGTSEEKEAWQYLQEAREATKASVWGAGNFIDFNNFK